MTWEIRTRELIPGDYVIIWRFLSNRASHVLDFHASLLKLDSYSPTRFNSRFLFSSVIIQHN